tara:strand:+ start:787 stop:978 length:192 start_codon:yes stop_codon:yes gene_type:complete
MPFESNIVFSKKSIEIIGAKLLLPGSINQIDPKIPKTKGIRKNLNNVFFRKFQIAYPVKKIRT